MSYKSNRRKCLRTLAQVFFLYHALTRFSPPLTRFSPPIISSISGEFALREKYVVFWYTNLQLTAESSHYLLWLKSLCSWGKSASGWGKARLATVVKRIWKVCTPTVLCRHRYFDVGMGFEKSWSLNKALCRQIGSRSIQRHFWGEKRNKKCCHVCSTPCSIFKILKSWNKFL